MANTIKRGKQDNVEHVRLGDLLVREGVLSVAQRDEVLAAQSQRGGPFGRLAEEMFGVHPQAVERAWSHQYASFAQRVDPRTLEISPEALQMISRRQAWQFRFLPIAVVDGGLVVCTTQSAVTRALRFAGWRLGHSCEMVLADPLHLGEALCKHYPMAGLTPEAVHEEMPSLAR